MKIAIEDDATSEASAIALGAGFGRCASVDDVSKIRLYASYPKTGSSLFKDVLDRLADGGGQKYVSRLTLGGEKHTFRIQGTRGEHVVLLKTHQTIGGQLDILRRPSTLQSHSAALLEQVTEGWSTSLFSAARGHVYVARNPFNVLLSAIRHIQRIYFAPKTAERWRSIGVTAPFFQDLLSLEKVPSPEAFARYYPLELPPNELESLLWRYLRKRGSIPIMNQGRELLTYFEHVNYYWRLFELSGNGAIFFYEDLVAANPSAIANLAEATGLPFDLLTEAWHEELRELRGDGEKSLESFYGAKRIGTPPEIKCLPSFPAMKRHVAMHCPPLAHLCD